MDSTHPKYDELVAALRLIQRAIALPRDDCSCQAAHDLATQLLNRLPNPVIVAHDANASEMNEKYGEAYGIDWTYPAG